MRRRAAGTRYVWLVCGTAVLGLDILSSLIPQRCGLGYATLRRVAIILYFCAGVGGGRIAGVGAGALAGAVTALVDATLGRTIAGAMGARPEPPWLGAIAASVVALATITTGAGIGLVGGVLGKVVHSRLADPSDPRGTHAHPPHPPRPFYSRRVLPAPRLDAAPRERARAGQHYRRLPAAG